MAARARPMRGVLLITTLWMALAGATARARTTVQAQVSGSAGVTNNLASDLSNPAPGQQTPEAGAFFNVTPRGTLLYETANAAHELFYSLSLDLYPNHADATSYGNRLGWSALLHPSAATQLSLSVQGYQGRESTLMLQDGAYATPLTIEPPGNVISVRGEVQEHFSWQFSPRWQALHELLAGGNHPISSDLPSPDSFDVTNGVGAQRQWTRDTLELRFRQTYLLSVGPADGATQHDLLLEPLAIWAHELTASWRTELGAGVEAAMRLDEPGEPVWQPSARGSIGYARDDAQASLVAAHRMQSNTFLGRLLLVDEVQLAGALPLGRHHRFIAALSTGYQYARGLDFNEGGLGDSSHAVVGDASLTWRAVSSLLLSARYQIIWQQNAFGPAEPLTYLRHLGVISVIFVYPETGALLARTSRGLRLIRSENEGEATQVQN